MDDSFAEYPRTIGELRSDKTDKSHDWTVRDMLISVLRDIDSGKGEYVKAERAVLILGNVDPDGSTNIQAVRAGTRNAWEGMGLLHEAMAMATRPA